MQQFLFERICINLAFITAFHYRDVQIYRRWRSIVNIWDPELSHAGDCDAASFVRAMWKQFLDDFGGVPMGTDMSMNMDAAYSDLYYAFREALDQAFHPGSSILVNITRQERTLLTQEIAGLEDRLNELNGRTKAKEWLLIEQDMMTMRPSWEPPVPHHHHHHHGCWYPPS